MLVPYVLWSIGDEGRGECFLLPVAMRITLTALPITSVGRFWHLGPLGMPIRPMPLVVRRWFWTALLGVSRNALSGERDP